MPWPPVLRTAFSTLDSSFYVRAGKFHVPVRHSLTKVTGALPPGGWVRFRRQR